METIIIAEHKRKYLPDLIISAVLLIGALTCFILWPAVPLPFVIFVVIVLLIIPSFVISGYIWDVTSKIELSKGGVIISHGRSIMEIVHFEANFTIPPDRKITWDTVADFAIESHSQESSGGSDGATTITTNSYLIIIIIHRDYSNGNTLSRHAIRLRRFDKSPDEILALCQQAQREYGQLLED